MSSPAWSTTDPDDRNDPLLRVSQAAARAGIKPSTWRFYVHKKLIPPPDDPDDTYLGEPIAPNARRPRWRTSTVDAFRDNRVGQGFRSDLRHDRQQQRADDAAALAHPTPERTGEVKAWLRTQHAAVLEVAEALADFREDLIDASSTPALLAEAIDAAGAILTREPSFALASATARALGVALGQSPGTELVRLDPDAEVRQILMRHRYLRDEFLRLPGARTG